MTKLDATAYLDNLGCAHVVYFHDDSPKTKETEFDFIKKRGRKPRTLLLHYPES